MLENIEITLRQCVTAVPVSELIVGFLSKKFKKHPDWSALPSQSQPLTSPPRTRCSLHCLEQWRLYMRVKIMPEMPQKSLSSTVVTC